MSNAIVASLRASLLAAGSPKVASEKAAYFKHAAQFYGVKTPQIEEIHAQQVVAPLRAMPDDAVQPTVRALLAQCVADPYHEVKQCGVLTVFRCKPKTAADAILLLDTAEGLLDNGHAADWATVDTLSSRVVAPCIQLAPSHAIPRITAWRSSPRLWKQRAAAVSFVKFAKLRDGYHDTIFTIAEALVQSQERFVQLGCGWVLREVSVDTLARDRVVDFIKTHYRFFSREGLRYAIEKMPAALRSELLAFSPKPTGLTTGGARCGEKRKR